MLVLEVISKSLLEFVWLPGLVAMITTREVVVLGTCPTEVLPDLGVKVTQTPRW
jgi:hypothetical protein